MDFLKKSVNLESKNNIVSFLHADDANKSNEWQKLSQWEISFEKK